MKRPRVAAGSIALAMLILATVTVPGQARTPSVPQATFSHPLTIDNPYLPLALGTQYVYDGISDKRPTHEVMTVTSKTRTIEGIQTRVVRDAVYEKGKLVEATNDYYAQDDAGNVWYFGERSAEYKNGKVVSTDGSWLAGVHGAEAGIVMEVSPSAGDTYAQEHASGIAQDMATVLSLSESICVPLGCFSNVVKTKEFSPLEPGVVEVKYYAAGVGEIKSVMTQGGTEESTLTAVQ